MAAASQGSCTHDDGFNVFQKPPGKGGTIAFNWHISYGMGWDGSASGGETDNIICRAANCPRSQSHSRRIRGKRGQKECAYSTSTRRWEAEPLHRPYLIMDWQNGKSVYGCITNRATRKILI